MKRTLLVMFVAAAGCVFADYVKPPEPFCVPELLAAGDGRRVTDAATWEKVRRPEVMKTLLENVYGFSSVGRPADLRFEETAPVEECFGGQCLRRRVRATYSGPGGKGWLDFSAWIPKKNGKAATFVYFSPRPAETAADPNGPRPTYLLPAEYIVSRGYAAIAMCDYDTALDFNQNLPVATNGVFLAFGPNDWNNRKISDWGILHAWAWGASRIMDWIETEPLLDAKRVATIGLSRNGKAALVAGATDQRFAMAVSCCSGTCGAKLNHITCDGSESIDAIMGPAWPWFCPKFREWIGKDTQMPFDQHWLLALMAPRLLYVSSASEDTWAGQRGEFASCTFASSAWNLYGKAGLVHHGFPKPDMPLHAGNIGYHLRSGVHDITLSDWTHYLDFADGHGWNL